VAESADPYKSVLSDGIAGELDWSGWASPERKIVKPGFRKGSIPPAPLRTCPVSIQIGFTEIRATAMIDQNQVKVYLAEDDKSKTLLALVQNRVITGFKIEPIVDEGFEEMKAEIKQEMIDALKNEGPSPAKTPKHWETLDEVDFSGEETKYQDILVHVDDPNGEKEPAPQVVWPPSSL
jgi:hypothetical protein